MYKQTLSSTLKTLVIDSKNVLVDLITLLPFACDIKSAKSKNLLQSSFRRLFYSKPLRFNFRLSIDLLFGYACHNTVLGNYKWSGDYAGFVQIELEKFYRGSVALFYQGAGADQNPLPRRTPELAIQYGKELAAAVERVISEDNMKPLTSQLVVSYSEIDLQFEKAPPTKEELKKIIDGTSEVEYADYLRKSAKSLMKILEKEGSLMSSYLYPVQVWKLGEQAIFSFGGELAVGYSLELKRIFGQDIFVFGYSNDVMAYIPTATILEEGGYEGTRSYVFTTPWASDIESKIIDTVVMMAKGLGVEELGDK